MPKFHFLFTFEFFPDNADLFIPFIFIVLFQHNMTLLEINPW